MYLNTRNALYSYGMIEMTTLPEFKKEALEQVKNAFDWYGGSLEVKLTRAIRYKQSLQVTVLVKGPGTIFNSDVKALPHFQHFNLLAKDTFEVNLILQED